MIKKITKLKNKKLFNFNKKNKNTKQYNLIKEISFDDKEAINQLIKIILQETDQSLKQAKELINQSKFQNASDIFHKIKGSISYLENKKIIEKLNKIRKIIKEKKSKNKILKEIYLFKDLWEEEKINLKEFTQKLNTKSY